MLSKKLVGRFLAAMALVGGALMAVPVLANADEAVNRCANWSMVEKTFTASGPGTLNLTGRTGMVTLPGQPDTCGALVYLNGYNATRSGDAFTVNSVTKATSVAQDVWRKGDVFTQDVAVPVGTNVVCVETAHDMQRVACWFVEVGSNADGTPATPTVIGPAKTTGPPPATNDDGPIGVCGHCV